MDGKTVIFQTIYAAIIFLRFFVYAVSIEEHLTWYEAFRTCKHYGKKLPSVIISEKNIRLANETISNAAESFWIGAKYERIQNYKDEMYPNVCCETLWKIGTNVSTECTDCTQTHEHVCARDRYSIEPQIKVNKIFTSWSLACKDCADRTLKLPDEMNEGLLEKATSHQEFWIDVVRRLNLDPNTMVEEDICLYYTNGRIYTANCHTRLKNVCFANSTLTLAIDTHFPDLAQSTSKTEMITMLTMVTIEDIYKIPANIYNNATSSPENWTLSGTIIGILSSLLLLAIISLLVISMRLRKGLRHVEQKGKSQDDFAQLDLPSSYQTLNSRNNQPENLYNTLQIE